MVQVTWLESIFLLMFWDVGEQVRGYGVQSSKEVHRGTLYNRLLDGRSFSRRATARITLLAFRSVKPQL